jgi:predicted nucleic acid-binding protein
MIQTGNPAAIYRAWQEGQFTLLTCAEHLDELRATLRKPAIAERIKPYNAGGLVNEMKKLAEIVDALPPVRRSPDPTDDFLLGLSEAGKADYLVTGDQSGLLKLEHHKGTRSVSARAFAALSTRRTPCPTCATPSASSPTKARSPKTRSRNI